MHQDTRSVRLIAVFKRTFTKLNQTILNHALIIYSFNDLNAFRNPTSGQRGILAKWPKFRNTTERFVKFKESRRLQIGKHFRDSHCELWRKIETDALEYITEKKSSIAIPPTVNETANLGDSFYYNVF